MVAVQLMPSFARPATAASEAASESEEDGPLWESIKRQLYKAEVAQVRRLVGETLIQQNKLMWAEAAALRQIVADYEQQSDDIAKGVKQQVQLCGTQHRDLLRRQAQIILEDLRAQAAACGQALEDVVPELRDEALRDYVTSRREPRSSGGCEALGLRLVSPTPPMTPSTRPPSSCGGVSVCSTPDLGLPALPLGRQLGVDELDGVAAGIREALQAEQESLLVAIAEQTQRFEAEDGRRASAKAGPAREPSTAELQQLVRKLQDIMVNPTLRTLALAENSSAQGRAETADAADGALEAQPISGGANVRRLRSLIAQRRRVGTGAPLPLGALPESPAGTGIPAANEGASGKPKFDPFFDDPFA